ncbi:hypothetical protein HDU97_004471, partial [Phlyctochytrium planicorne]
SLDINAPAATAGGNTTTGKLQHQAGESSSVSEHHGVGDKMKDMGEKMKEGVEKSASDVKERAHNIMEKGKKMMGAEE